MHEFDNRCPMRSARQLLCGAVLAVSAALLLPATPAGAASIYGAGGGQGLWYYASPGEENQVRVWYDAGNLMIRDTGAGTPIEDGSDGCSVSGREITCPGNPGSLSLGLDDLDDLATIAATVPPTEVMQADGQTGDDTLRGSVTRDMLTGGAGVDELSGGGARDQLDGGPDADQVNGSAGTDWVSGGAGGDGVLGGTGIDSLEGGPGDDELDGGSGDDVLYADPGSDLLEGGNDFDVASYEGRDAAVTVTIGAGVADDGNEEDGPAGARDEVLSTVEGVNGGLGNDRLVGDEADNELLGLYGHDELLGLGGNDGLEGAAGRDVLRGGFGSDSLDGGRDNDFLVSQGGGRDDDDCGGGTDVADADALDTVAGDCETVN
jgi:hypothetical protein